MKGFVDTPLISTHISTRGRPGNYRPEYCSSRWSEGQFYQKIARIRNKSGKLCRFSSSYRSEPFFYSNKLDLDRSVPISGRTRHSYTCGLRRSSIQYRSLLGSGYILHVLYPYRTVGWSMSRSWWYLLSAKRKFLRTSRAKPLTLNHSTMIYSQNALYIQDALYRIRSQV